MRCEVFKLKGKDFINRLLKYDNIKEIVERDIKWALENKRKLREEKYPKEPLTTALEIIITRSYWRTWPWNRIKEKLKEKDFIVNGEVLVGYEDLDTVLKIVNEIYRKTGKRFWKETYNSLANFKSALEKAKSLRKWIKELYKLVNEEAGWKSHEYFKGIKGLGFKGVNLLLRDMGFFDMVPIDIHERRFLLRTGIALCYGSPSGDPASLEYYIEALRSFCKECLEDFKLKDLFKNITEVPREYETLSKAPGIVDWIIWYFACEREVEECKNICSSKPKCSLCPIRDLCLYSSLKL